MTISQSQKQIIAKLDKLDLTNPRLEADVLLFFVLQKSRAWVLSRPEFKLTRFQIFRIRNLARQRIKGKSLALLTGEKEFYGLRFKVNKHVLVPRPETEMMVDVIRKQKIENRKQTIFVDVGTGSGCIIISLAKKFKKLQYPIPNIKYLAVDNSKKALRVAKQNAILHGLENKIKFLHGNLLSPLIKSNLITNYQSPITILANLPYLTPEQLKHSPTVQFEPKNALVGGSDGLKYYRELFEQLKSLKNKKITVLCEIDDSQADAISELIKEKLPEYKFQIKKDLRGHFRLAIINNQVTINKK